MTYRKQPISRGSGDTKSMHEEEAMNDDRFRLEIASGTRICNPCGGKIRNEEKCLSFSKGSGRYCVRGNVCKKCLISFVEKLQRR